MKRKFTIFGAVFSGVMLCFVCMYAVKETMNSSKIVTNGLFYMILLVSCLYRIYKGEAYFENKKNKKSEKERRIKQDKQREKDRMELEKLNNKLDNGKAIADFKAQHIYGLPIPEGTVFNFVMKSDGALLTVNKDMTFSIPMNRVIGVNSIVKKDVVQILKSDYGKAVLGRLLFGDAGAILGGMPESSFANRYTKLYIFAYKAKNGQDSTLMFMADNEWIADQFVSHIKLLKPVDEDSKRIEL